LREPYVNNNNLMRHTFQVIAMADAPVSGSMRRGWETLQDAVGRSGAMVPLSSVEPSSRRRPYKV